MQQNLRNYFEYMDYNTEKEKLVLPEYGRNVLNMVKHAMTIGDREKRLCCARQIVRVMSRILPKEKQSADYEHVLWDHLALLSNYELDIDWPYEITRVDEVKRPEKMKYPMSNIRKRQYGHLVESLIAEIKDMEPGAERERILGLAANQMRKDLYYSNKNSLNEKRVADDLYHLSNGKIELKQGQINYSQSIPTGNTSKSRRSSRKNK